MSRITLTGAILCLFASLSAGAQTVTVSGADPAIVNGTYEFQFSIDGHEYYFLFVAPGVDLIWNGTLSQWQIQVGPDLYFVNTNDCGASPPDTGWINGPFGNTPPTLTGSVCSLLPVELTSVSAGVDEGDIVVSWVTSSETNNAGFEVQLSSAERQTTTESGWDVAGFVEGHGSTLGSIRYSFRIADALPGRHRIRLAQIDFDGRRSISPEIEVHVELAKAFYMEAAYPNPFNPSTTIRFIVIEAQRIKMEVYDVTGHLRLIPFDVEVGADQVIEARIDAGRLPSGIYLVRVVGERFEESQQITLVK